MLLHDLSYIKHIDLTIVNQLEADALYNLCEMNVHMVNDILVNYVMIHDKLHIDHRLCNVLF